MIEVIIKCAGFYICVGFLFVIHETFERNRENKRSNTINRIKVIVGWLPAVFSNRVARWLLLKRKIMPAGAALARHLGRNKIKRLYDRRSMQTDISQEFGRRIDKSTRPIFEEYLKNGFCVRDLSHEALGVLRDIELGHIMTIQVEETQKEVENQKRRLPNIQFRPIKQGD